MQDEDLNPEQWLGLPTPEEMWRQQAQLCAEECNILQQSLTEQRKRIASLVTMFVEADKERVRLRTELAKALKTASDAHLSDSENWKKWHQECLARSSDQAFFSMSSHSLEGIRTQLLPRPTIANYWKQRPATIQRLRPARPSDCRIG